MKKGCWGQEMAGNNGGKNLVVSHHFVFRHFCPDCKCGVPREARLRPVSRYPKLCCPGGTCHGTSAHASTKTVVLLGTTVRPSIGFRPPAPMPGLTLAVSLSSCFTEGPETMCHKQIGAPPPPVGGLIWGVYRLICAGKSIAKTRLPHLGCFWPLLPTGVCSLCFWVILWSLLDTFGHV